MSPTNRLAPFTRPLRLVFTLAFALASLLGLASTPQVHAASGDCITNSGTVTCTFTYTSAAQTWTVPAGVTTVTVEAYGGSGGQSIYGAAPGGNGGHLKATLPVNPGDTLDLIVAAAGGGDFA